MFLLYVLLAKGALMAQFPDKAQVVVINLRGASKSMIDRLLADSAPPRESAFRWLNRNAVLAQSLEPVANAVTAVNNATLESGVYPSAHGIVGNSFAAKGGPQLINASGFTAPFLAETIWEQAARNGKKVIRLGVLQSNGFAPNDFSVPTLPQTAPLTESQVLNLTPVPCSYRFEKTKAEHYQCLTVSGVLPFTLSFGAWRKEAVFVALDTETDGVRRFQTLLLDDDFDERNGEIAQVALGEWFDWQISTTYPAAAGVYAKLLKLAPDLHETQIYLGPVFQNQGYPASFVAEAEREAGFNPGGPDYAGYLQGKIDRLTLLEQARRESDYFVRLALFCLQRLPFDLLMVDHPLLDRYGHYLYAKPKHLDNLPAMQPGYAATGENLLTLLNAIDKRNTALLAVSGHGFSAAHTSFSLRKILESVGVTVAPTENAGVTAIGSKVSAHIYLNRRSFDENANRRFVSQLRDKLRRYRAPATGATIFDNVLTAAETKHRQLFNPQRSGDLWLCLKPGYTFDGIIPPGALTGRPTFAGEHGYFDPAPQAKGLLYLYLPDKTRRFAKSKDIAGVKILIKQLLGL
jgi:hypothetical protein